MISEDQEEFGTQTETDVPHVVIYGAATKLPPNFEAEARRTPIQKLKLLRDCGMASIGSARFLRYESYVSDRSVNMGDLSIADTVHGFARRLLGSQIRVSRVDWGQPLPDEHIDWLLVSGGGYFFLDSRGRLPQRVENDAQTWHRRRIRYVFVGVGINQLLSTAGHDLAIADESKGTLQHLLDGSSGISVRDSATLHALSALTCQPVALIGDPALHWSQLFADRSHSQQRLSARPQVGINFPMHGRDSARRLREQFPAYVRFLRELQQHLNCDFRFISHFESSTVLPRLFAMQGLPMTLAYGPPSALAETYRQLDVHLGGKLHSCILASSFGIPNVGLAYDRKHFGFFEIMHSMERCVAAEPLPSAHLLELLSKALKDRLSINATLMERQKHLRDVTLRFLGEALSSYAAPQSAAPTHP